METFKTTLTNYGRDEIANFLITQVPIKLVALAAGDGGGKYYEPASHQTSLLNEIWRGPISNLLSLDNVDGDIVAEAVISPEASSDGDGYLREVGIYDDKGSLFAVGQYPLTFLPDLSTGATKQIHIRIIIGVGVGNTAAIKLAVEHSTVMETKSDNDYLQSEIDNSIRYLTPEMYEGNTGSVSEMIQACADAAKALKMPVIATGTYLLTAPVSLDSLQWIGGTFKGNGVVLATMLDCTIHNLTFDGVYLQMLGGDCRVRNSTFKNQKFTAAFFISAMTKPGTLEFTDNELSACNYAILQQASGEKMLYARFSRNNIHDTKGDGIELNVVNLHYPNGLLIENNRLHNIDGTGKGTFWGIGIGIAGAGPYGVDADDSQYVSNFTIRNNRISGCRQCIHVEMGRDFSIVHNECFPDITKSIDVGLYFSAVAIYGCRSFTIDNLRGEPVGTSDRFILIDWGVNGGAYAGPPRNFTLSNISTSRGSVEITTAGADAWDNTTIVENMRCSVLKWRGLPPISIFRNIFARKIDFIGQHAFGEGSGGGTYTRAGYAYTNWSNVVCLTDTLANVSISKLQVERADEVGNNFALPSYEGARGHRGPRLVTSTEQYKLEDDIFPGGREFSAGTILWKLSGGYFLVTKAGAYIKTSGTFVDAIKETAVGQTYLQGNMLNWGSGYGTKSAGTRLIVPGAGVNGTDLTVTITRSAYGVNGIWHIDIAPAISTATPQNTIIRAAYPVEFIEK